MMRSKAHDYSSQLPRLHLPRGRGNRRATLGRKNLPT